MTFSQKFKALENICVETLTLKKTKKLKGDVLCQRSKVTFVDPRIMVSQNKKKTFPENYFDLCHSINIFVRKFLKNNL